jgi:hypothetical protein
MAAYTSGTTISGTRKRTTYSATWSVPMRHAMAATSAAIARTATVKNRVSSGRSRIGRDVTVRVRW